MLTCPVCLNCGAAIIVNRRTSGRKRRYCNNRCRDEARRQRHFENPRNKKTATGALKKAGRYPHSGDPRNAKNIPTISSGCEPVFAGRGSALNGLWRRIVQIEVIDARLWAEVVSSDGIRSWVARVAP